MTFADRWRSLPHAGGTAGPRTVGWMEATTREHPGHAYVGEDAILVALPVHERLVDLYMAGRDEQALKAALDRELPRLLAVIGPRPAIVAKGSEGHLLEPYGFERVDELLYYVMDPLQEGADHPAIRSATMDDFAALLALDQASFPIPYQRGPNEMRVHIEGTSLVKVLEADGEIFGFSILQPLGERYHLGAVGVHPDRQRRGWGRVLFLEAVHAAHQAGATSLGLTTQVSNTPSRRIYERVGMVAEPLGPVWARGGL